MVIEHPELLPICMGHGPLQGIRLKDNIRVCKQDVFPGGDDRSLF